MISEGYCDADGALCSNIMKVLVTGAGGQLGQDVKTALENENIDCLGVDYNDFDITDKTDTTLFIEKYDPDVIIHCAAYTAVDKAEDDEKKCLDINAGGTQNIAEAAEKTNSKLVYISTDYVFDGNAVNPFETTSSKGPLNVYGKSKLMGEEYVLNICKKHFIIRVSWLFGTKGDNFIKSMLNASKTKDEISVVEDQVGSPTFTEDLASLIIQMIQTEKYGVYHATNEGFCSWYQFACEIFRQAGINVKVKPVKSGEYITRAKRPYNSKLSKTSLSSAGFPLLPPWEDALKRFLGKVL